MKLYQIPRRPPQKSSVIAIPKTITRKYNLNINFFKCWSKQFAWVLGWIFTDGYYLNGSKNGHYGFRIGLSPKDKKF